MSLRIAINGFGRIGRSFLRSVLAGKDARRKINIVAINTGPNKHSNLDILFKYDSIMGTYKGDVQIDENKLKIDDVLIDIVSEADPAKCGWKEREIDWIIEASGHFTNSEKAEQHRKAGAQKVLITAPAQNPNITIIPGINHDQYDASTHHIVSLGSCTTNAFAPMVKVLHETFGIREGLMTTTHAYTNDQVLIDVEHKDPRRARAAGFNIIPTKTGADSVITEIFQDLKGKIRATALRVPVPIVSLIDFTFVSEREVSIDSINKAYKKYAASSLENILAYIEKPLVSSDFIGSEYSCSFDSQLTTTTSSLAKVFGWYDNEYGYSCRLRDFLLHNT